MLMQNLPAEATASTHGDGYSIDGDKTTRKGRKEESSFVDCQPPTSLLFIHVPRQFPPSPNLLPFYSHSCLQGNSPRSREMLIWTVCMDCLGSLLITYPSLSPRGSRFLRTMLLAHWPLEGGSGWGSQCSRSFPMIRRQLMRCTRARVGINQGLAEERIFQAHHITDVHWSHLLAFLRRPPQKIKGDHRFIFSQIQTNSMARP